MPLRDRIDPRPLPHLDPPPEPPREVRLVRLRLLLVLGATSILSLLAGGLLVALVVPGFGSYATSIVDRAPRVALVLLAAAFVTAISVLGWMVRQVLKPAEELAASRREYSDLYLSARSHALEDSLTRLGNHRAFTDAVDRRLAAAAGLGVPLSLVLLDVDGLKGVNDSAGHAAGDALLVRLADLLIGGLRTEDGVYRIGGDEFAVIMPATGAEDAAVVTRRIIETASASGEAGVPRVGFSAGIAAAPDDGASREALVAAADEALYRAKRHGRGTVRLHDDGADDEIPAVRPPTAVQADADDIEQAPLLPGRSGRAGWTQAGWTGTGWTIGS